VPAVSPYQTALALARPAPDYTPAPEDSARVQAYWTYADIYTNVSDAFAAILREGDDMKSRRYIPVARSIIEATNRFLAQGLEWVAAIPPDVTISDEDRDAQMTAVQDLFQREEFMAKFMAMKRWMLIKGDALLQISADPLKPQGTRIRITEVTPEQYFPIFDAVDTDRVIGCYIVTQLVHGKDPVVAQRMEYRRLLNQDMATEFGGPIGGVFAKIGYYEKDKWDDRSPLTAESLVPIDPPEWMPEIDPLLLAGGVLPADITAIPIYHFRNRRHGTEPFGLSELQGIETVLAGVIQNATDEDMAVALMGIGLYTTDSGRPRDDDGVEVEWSISPASVVELEDGKQFNKVDGVTTVQPIQDHIELLKAEARETTATPDVAVGKVDVAAAESGVALAIQMFPITAKNAETEVEISAKLDQLLYDLVNGWMPAYEGTPVTGLIVTSMFGDPLPPNRKETIDELVALAGAGIIDAEFAREFLTAKLGFKFPADMQARMDAAAAKALDEVGGRLGAAAGDGTDPTADPNAI